MAGGADARGNLTDGNVSQAAELLGVTRPTFYALANKYRLDIGRGG